MVGLAVDAYAIGAAHGGDNADRIAAESSRLSACLSLRRRATARTAAAVRPFPLNRRRGLLLLRLNYGRISNMTDATTVKHDNKRSSLSPFFASQDGELAIKAMRGIADIEAARCAPVAEVRERLLSRYEPSRACV